MARRKGLPEEDIKGRNWEEERFLQYDILAKGMRESLDMDFVYRVLEGKA